MKIGMHIHYLDNDTVNAVRLVKPAVIKIMDPTAEWIKTIRKITDVPIVVRMYEHGVPFQNRSAEGWADAIAATISGAPLDNILASSYNEPFGHDSVHLFPQLDEWQIRVLRRLAHHGIGCTVCNFGTGNFTAGDNRVKIPDAFPLSCEAEFFEPHDYDWPNIWRSEGWRAMRWLAWLDDIEAAGHGRKKIIVGEWGLTRATYGGPDLGWLSSDEVSTEAYLRQMGEYDRRVAAMPECIGFCPFDWCGRGPFGWDSFEHLPIAAQVAVLQQYTLPPQPPPPTEEDMEIEVIDLNGIKRDINWAKAKYGVEIVPAEEFASIAEGRPVYRVVKLWEQEGINALITKVLDENGLPQSGVGVALYWPDAPDGGDPPTTLLAHDCKTKFIHGPTNMSGDVGPGMGRGAFHGYGEGGPHAVWVRDPNVPSDLADKWGMLAGTHYLHLQIVYQKVVGSAPPTPQPPTPNAGYIQELKDAGAKITQIATILEEADRQADELRAHVQELSEQVEDLADTL